MPSIPASAIVNVTPNVIGAGGSGLDLIGLLLTNSTRTPVGSVLRFASAGDVSAYFGPLATETSLAQTYFAAFDTSDIKPAALLISQYPSAPVAAYLRGANLGLTLTALQALTGTLSLTVEGTAKTSSTINLSGATSFSNAATIIQAAFTSPGFTVTYDSVSGGFVFTDATTGATSTLTYASGTLATPLSLTQATGAVLSQGSAAATPAAAMDAISDQTQDFASFMTSFEPVDADKLAFAAWNNAQDNRFLYAMWDDDIVATTSTDTSSAGYLIGQAGYSGTVPIYDPNNGAAVAAFLMGSIAAINFAATNGRTNLTFRSGDGLFAGVTNRTLAANLIANGYNFYGSYATANDQFVWFYPGQVSGSFRWIDSYINQIWLNNGFQLALMTLLGASGSIPYNADGYGLIEAAMLDQVDQAVSFGAIRAGVSLSNAQAAEVNTKAGKKVSDTLQQRGWYTSVADPGPQVRGQRGSPVCYFFYTDGQSVQTIDLSSVLVV